MKLVTYLFTWYVYTCIQFLLRTDFEKFSFYPPLPHHLCDHASWQILIIKPTRCTNFSNLFLEWNSTCFGQFLCPSSGVFHCTRSSGICHTGLLTACEQDQDETFWSCSQTCIIYTIVVCTVKNSRCWTEELSETCRVLFQNKFDKLVHLVGFIIVRIKAF